MNTSTIFIGHCTCHLHELYNTRTYPGVANCDLVEATAISQLATNWQPAAVASPDERIYSNFILFNQNNVTAKKAFIVNKHAGANVYMNQSRIIGKFQFKSKELKTL